MARVSFSTCLCLPFGSYIPHRFFNHPTGNRLGLYAASFYISSVPAAFIGDVLANRYGRRVAIFTGSVFVIAGSLINALAVNVAMWIAGKVVIHRKSADRLRACNYRSRRGCSQSCCSSPHSGNRSSSTPTDSSCLLLVVLSYRSDSCRIHVL